MFMGGNDWFNWFRIEKSPYSCHGQGEDTEDTEEEEKHGPTASLHPSSPSPPATAQAGLRDGPGSLPCLALGKFGNRAGTSCFGMM